MKLQFEIEGRKELSRRLEKISNDSQNWQNTFEKVGLRLANFFGGEVFRTEGAVFGEPWEALSDSTVRQKLKKGYTPKPLVASGTMQKSFNYNAAPMSVEVFNPVDYFKYHQSNKPRKKLPRRIMMKLDEMRKQIIVKEFHKDYRKKIEKS